MTAGRAVLLAPGADLSSSFAQALVERRRQQLPDLSADCLLLPSAMPVAPLRAALASAAGGALLGPRVETFARFAAGFASQAALPAFECRLLLVDALRRRRGPFPGQDPWLLADALYEIFESLAAEGAALHDDEAAFETQLAQAYGSRPMAALSREARIVHQLWRAWLIASEGRSPAQLQTAALHAACAALAPGQHLHLLGHDRLSGTERAALKPLLHTGQATLWLQGRLEGRDGVALRALCQQLDLDVESLPCASTARARFLDQALALPSGAAADADPQLVMLAADGPEHEARCVELAVREALLAGARSVAVVTEDRRLARRLRALLERAGVVLDDEIGWALSTSAAAAALNAWLDALDSGFQFRPLLGLLKSAFLHADASAVASLERELVYRRGIEAGLTNFRARSEDKKLRALLDQLTDAAAQLPSLREARAGGDWLAALRRSLETLGLLSSFAADDAGRVLLATLEDLQAGFAALPLSQRWSEFRALLDRALEAASFRPQRRGSVRLLTLDRAAGLRCDALILAAATRAQLPSAPAGEAFFNQAVRAELGLPTASERQQLALCRLRRVLEAAPRVSISYAAEAAGEPAQLSPWIEALEHQALRGGWTLRDTQLGRRAGTAAVEIAQTASRAAERRTRPAPRAPISLLPQQLSATAHQSLIDCPYQFFARGALALRTETAPDEDPDRSDYGQRVHAILQAFTQATESLPGPFRRAVNAANREEAEALLRNIADAVFADDLRERALAHVWRTEFDSMLPRLLDWLIERPAASVRAEQTLARALDERWTLEGRADRIEDLGDEGWIIVDYKTGRALPTRAEVEAGEAVQLVHYALLDDHVAQVEYLSLGADRKPMVLKEAELDELRDAVGGRLLELLAALTHWTPLPALGAESVCNHCDFGGLCRKQDWVSEGDGEAPLGAFANAEPSTAGPRLGNGAGLAAGITSTSGDKPK